MANIPVPFMSGGGSGDSSECTATAEDILESKTAIYNGSNDEPANGSMKDYSGTTQSATASLDESNSRVQMAVPNTGKYNTNARLYSSYSNMASTIGLTAAKLGTGQSVLGITGTYKPTRQNMNVSTYRGFNSSSGGDLGPYEESFTLPADGICYYCGFAAGYYSSGRPTIVCEIYLNGVLQDNRDIDSSNTYVTRMTMFNKSFNVSKGDVVKIVSGVTTATHGISVVNTEILYYE